MWIKFDGKKDRIIIKNPSWEEEAQVSITVDKWYHIVGDGEEVLFDGKEIREGDK